MMSERELLQHYAETGDAEAFAGLVRAYQGLVYATCRRGLHCPDDLDDAVQETFLRLARKAGAIRTNLGAWLHRCAVNVSLDLNRRRQARHRHETVAGITADAASPEQREIAELREQVDAALTRLEAEQRELIIERYFVGRAMAELAKEQGVTPSAMTYRMEKAVSSLRAELETLGCAVGVEPIVAMLECEGNAHVPLALTASVMRIGLKGVGAAGVAGIGIAGGKLGLAAAAMLVVGGVWLALQLAAGPAATSMAPAPSPAPASRPAGPVALIEQGPPAAAPKWDAAAPGATPAVLSGRIVDEMGKPVAGASVHLSGQGAYPPATTDKDGRYAFAAAGPDGEYEIEVVATGYVHTGRSGPRQEKPVKLMLSRTAEARRDVVLERGTAVVVNVLDQNGNPISGARVAIASEESGVHQSRDELYAGQDTDKSGMVVQTMPQGKRYVVAAVAGGMAPSHQMVMLEKGSDVMDVQLVLAAGHEVRGVVICSDGKPAAGYSVELNPAWWNAGHIPNWGQAQLSEKGEFVLPASEGDNYVCLWDEHGGQGIGKIQVPAEGDVVRLTAPMPSKSALTNIRGQVRLVGKRPEKGIAVYAKPANGISEHDAWVQFDPRDPETGHYEIKGVAPGEYSLRFTPPNVKGGRLGFIKVPGDVPLVELTVQEKARLAGQVVDAVTGKPLTQFAVRLAWQDPAWTQVAQGEGRFSLDVPEAGEYQVQVSAAGYARAWTDSVRVGAGEETQVIVKMVAGGSLIGCVVDEAGKPVPGARIMAYSASHWERAQTRRRNLEVEAVTTDERGEFAWPHLPPGATQVEVVHPEFVSRVADTTVIDGQSANMGNIVLLTGGTVEGTVYGENGQPASGASVIVEDDDPGTRMESKTDADGKYRLAHRPERRQTLMIGWPDMTSMQRWVRPSNGRSTQVDFSPPQRVVSGRLLDGGAPKVHRYVSLSGKEWRSGHVQAMASTDEKGGFVFRGIPHGQYTLSSENDVFRVIDVPADNAVDLGDVQVDCATVQVSIDAADPADVQRLVGVGVVSPGIGDWPIRSTEDGWQGITAATEFRARAEYKIENATVMYWIPCRRTPGQKVVKVAMHLPQRSSTLIIGPREDSEAWPAMAWIESEDGSVIVTVSPESKQGKTLRLPPGKYHVRDIHRGKPRVGIPPIVLEEGKTAEISAASVVTPRSATVRVDVWTDKGLLAEVQPSVFGTDGEELARDERRIDRWTWNLRPGTYQARAEANGKVVTRDVLVTRELVASERPVLDVDILLPEIASQKH